jgi:hypothetical protein
METIRVSKENSSLLHQFMVSSRREETHTPLGVFITLLSGALHDVVTQDVCDLDCMVDLHAGVDGWATVLVEVLAGLLTSSEENREIV